MKTVMKVTCLVALAACLLPGCSKKEKPPVAKPAPPAKALVNVVHDAVKFYAGGGQTFQAPPGVKVESSKLAKNEGGKKVEYLQVAGLQEKGPSLAVIVFRIPGTWLTTEKEKLTTLDNEVRDLNACAQTLRENEAKGITADPKAPCHALEIVANNKPGITIQDERVKHIEMMIYR